MANKNNLTQVYQDVARQIRSILIAQAPVYKGERKDIKKGLLKGSIGVTADANGWAIREKKYGMFLNQGTGSYKNPSTTAAWNPNPGRGKGGIRPRYWENIPRETELKIMDTIITAIINQDIQLIQDELSDI